MERKDKFEKIFNYSIGCLGLVGVLATVVTLFVALRSPSIVIQLIEQVSNLPTATPIVVEVTSEGRTELPTSYPTDTPYPTNTSYPTYTPVPEPTNTLSPSSTPTLSLILPFRDTFDSSLRPEWKILSGEPVIQNGKLSPISGGNLILQIGDDSLSNYTISLQYDAYLNVPRVIFTIAGKIRFECNFWGSVLKVQKDNQWQDIASGSGCKGNGQMGISIKGNEYRAFDNQNQILQVIYGSQVNGPLILELGGSTIDNVEITQP